MSLMAFMQLDEQRLDGVRKTTESPPRLSVHDLVGCVVGQKPSNARNYWYRLLGTHPELATNCSQFKFPGRGGGRPVPVTDVRGATEIVLVLQGKAAAEVRKNSADVLVRYFGGDPRIVDEVLANRLMQDRLAREAPEHPARIFGEAVEAEVKHEPPEPLTKRCSSCSEFFPVEFFRKDSSASDLLYCQCRACEKEDRDERLKRLREEPEVEEPERKRLRPQDQTLYVVSVTMPGVDDCVERLGYKIGRTIDTDGRLDSITGSLPRGPQFDLVVHALFPNAGHLERALHRRFRDRAVEAHRCREWFRVPLEEILREIAELKAR